MRKPQLIALRLPPNAGALKTAEINSWRHGALAVVSSPPHLSFHLCPHPIKCSWRPWRHGGWLSPPSSTPRYPTPTKILTATSFPKCPCTLPGSSPPRTSTPSSMFSPIACPVRIRLCLAPVWRRLSPAVAPGGALRRARVTSGPVGGKRSWCFGPARQFRPTRSWFSICCRLRKSASRMRKRLICVARPPVRFTWQASLSRWCSSTQRFEPGDSDRTILCSLHWRLLALVSSSGWAMFPMKATTACNSGRCLFARRSGTRGDACRGMSARLCNEHVCYTRLGLSRCATGLQCCSVVRLRSSCLA